MATMTITFGEQALTHIGMESIGKMHEEGFNLEDLKKIRSQFEKTELINIHESFPIQLKTAESAYLLIIRNGIKQLDIDDLKLLKEQKKLEWDKKAFIHGRVVNKKARYDLCYDDHNQIPDYSNKKGRIIS